MKAFASFTVRPSLPAALAPLGELAANLRWSWDEPTRDLFRSIDPAIWNETRHDPVQVLSLVPWKRLEELANDGAFLSRLSEVHGKLSGYLTDQRWFQFRDSPLRAVAYFSPEFGITEALPQYSGGLGILAGDHLKAASDLGVPIIGIGLFYRNGYFRQSLNLDGWQQERFPAQDPYAMALTATGARFNLDLGGETCVVQVWRADVGRTPLFLLDTDVEENSLDVRAVTDRLYGGESEHRLRQEIVLGMGGVKALRTLGIDAQVFHSNEGHAGFLGLERMRDLIGTGLSYDEALEAVRAGGVFTTHTPVPAGIDRFTHDLIRKYFTGWAKDCGVSIDRLLELGQRSDEIDGRHNMAYMGLRLGARANAVAKLHGAVSREMFAPLWPEVPVEEVPIGSITNGVHAPTWVDDDLADLLHDRVHPIWDGASAQEWERARDLPDAELWSLRNRGRAALVDFVRERLRASLERRGMSPSDAEFADSVLDPDVLTIGFARRFATYKRANLLLAQRDRLLALLLHSTRPIQFVFAGKAHPADDPGKTIIQELARFAADHGVRHRFVFIDDYDIAVARAFYRGCDVWLNNPRRPLEACGTSGMKSALNGGLNCSILDGWWDECFDGSNGWAITSAESEPDLIKRDRIEADSLFDLLEHQVVPLFYDRSSTLTRRADDGVQGEGLPVRWLERVKHNFVTLGPFLTASRMVRDYVTELYEPAAVSSDAVLADRGALARELAAWKKTVRSSWSAVRLVHAGDGHSETRLGTEHQVTAMVDLGGLAPSDVAVELLHGPVGGIDELAPVGTVALTATGVVDGHQEYRGTFTVGVAGRYGFTVRVRPDHRALANPVELGLVHWAS